MKLRLRHAGDTPAVNSWLIAWRADSLARISIQLTRPAFLQAWGEIQTWRSRK
jgi:hypothetical protein